MTRHDDSTRYRTPAADAVTAAAPPLAPLLRNAALRLAHGLRAPAAGHGLTPTRLTALAILSAHAPLRVSDLARHLGTSMPSASRLLDTLVDADLAERRSDPDDQRACLVVLTPHGTDVLDEVRRESLRLLTDHLIALPDEQLARLATALPTLDALAHSLAPGPLSPARACPEASPEGTWGAPRATCARAVCGCHVSLSHSGRPRWFRFPGAQAEGTRSHAPPAREGDSRSAAQTAEPPLQQHQQIRQDR